MDEAAMEQPAPPQNARQRLMQTIMELGNKAFNPDASEISRVRGQREFNDFVERQARSSPCSKWSLMV
jgi:hypothetical protein